MSSCQEIGIGPSKGGAFDRAIASKFGRYNSLEKGAHKGRPYRLSFLGVLAGGGHPQEVPLRMDKGCPRGGEGDQKGRPYPIQAASRGFF